MSWCCQGITTKESVGEKGIEYQKAAQQEKEREIESKVEREKDKTKFLRRENL